MNSHTPACIPSSVEDISSIGIFGDYALSECNTILDSTRSIVLGLIYFDCVNCIISQNKYEQLIISPRYSPLMKTDYADLSYPNIKTRHNRPVTVVYDYKI